MEVPQAAGDALVRLELRLLLTDQEVPSVVDQQRTSGNIANAYLARGEHRDDDPEHGRRCGVEHEHPSANRGSTPIDVRANRLEIVIGYVW